MMKLLSLGDSFTYGEELADLDNAWPHVLGRKFGAEVTNLGEPGCSNDTIVRKLFQHELNNTSDLILIGLTSPGRVEYADSAGCYTMWPGYSGKSWSNINQHRQELQRYTTMNHNDAWLVERYLREIILLQNYFKQQNQRYLMVNVCNGDYYLKWIDNRPIISMYSKMIDFTHFLGFKPENSMTGWTFGASRGPRGHFLDEGHVRVADKLYEHIRNFGWIS